MRYIGANLKNIDIGMPLHCFRVTCGREEKNVRTDYLVRTYLVQLYLLPLTRGFLYLTCLLVINLLASFWSQATVQAHGYVKVDPRWISLPASLRSLFKQEAGSAPAKHDIPIPRQAAAVRLVPSHICGVGDSVVLLKIFFGQETKNRQERFFGQCHPSRTAHMFWWQRAWE